LNLPKRRNYGASLRHLICPEQSKTSITVAREDNNLVRSADLAQIRELRWNGHVVLHWVIVLFLILVEVLRTSNLQFVQPYKLTLGDRHNSAATDYVILGVEGVGRQIGGRKIHDPHVPVFNLSAYLDVIRRITTSTPSWGASVLACNARYITDPKSRPILTPR